MKIDKKSVYISAGGFLVGALITLLVPSITPQGAEYSMFLLKSAVIFFVIGSCLKNEEN
jgi:hypothetical protein